MSNETLKPYFGNIKIKYTHKKKTLENKKTYSSQQGNTETQQTYFYVSALPLPTFPSFLPKSQMILLEVEQGERNFP